MFADEFLPVYDVSDEVATVVDADPPVVWEALLGADLVEVGSGAHILVHALLEMIRQTAEDAPAAGAEQAR
jgi:hypothetical protein